MIEWILHRPPHASHPSEIRVAERLKSLDASPYPWTVIWGYYYQDSRGMQREGATPVRVDGTTYLLLSVKKRSDGTIPVVEVSSNLVD